MDIGELTGPVLLFGGPYSNRHALEALRAEAHVMAIPPSNVICTGDVVAYCGEPAATVALIREWGCHVVAGNCEEQLAAGAFDCGCGFEEGTVCDALSAEWFGFASAQIDDDARRWMANVPAVITFQHDGKRWAVIHGGAVETNKIIWSSDLWAVKAVEIDVLEARLGPLDGVVCGHTGQAFSQMQNGKTWLNAGAIGMPSNDGDQSTEYAILDATLGAAAVIRRLSYDAHAAAAAISGRETPYRDALVTGLWPSEDALPQSLRRQT